MLSLVRSVAPFLILYFNQEEKPHSSSKQEVVCFFNTLQVPQLKE